MWQVVTNFSKEHSNLCGVITQKSTTDAANVMSSTNGCLIHYLKLVDKEEHIAVDKICGLYLCHSGKHTEQSVR